MITTAIVAVGLMSTAVDGGEPTAGAYAVFRVCDQNIAIGTLRKNNAWLAWRGETPAVDLFSIPIHAAVTAGFTVDRKPIYAISERDWRKTMLSAQRPTSDPLWRRNLATKVGNKTESSKFVMLSVGAEVSPNAVVRISKSDGLHLSFEWTL